jgi:DNA-binding transcriptional MocR family regulator
VIDLSGPQPLWPTDAALLWARCAATAARDTDAWAASPPGGDPQLREQLAALWAADPDEITVVAGARAAAAAYGRLADRVLLERPTFSGITHALAAVRARWAQVPWDRLDRAPQGTAVWVTSPCRNPDGASLPPDAIRRMAARGRLIVNRSYQWFADEPPPTHGDLVLSLHKLAGRGARLAAVRSADFASAAADFLPFLTPPVHWQRAWARFLREGGVRLLGAEHISRVRASSDAFRSELRTLGTGFAPAGTGPNVLVPLRRGIGEDAAVGALAARGFQVLAGRHFAACSPSIRVNFSAVHPEPAARFARALASSGILPG